MSAHPMSRSYEISQNQPNRPGRPLMKSATVASIAVGPGAGKEIATMIRTDRMSNTMSVGRRARGASLADEKSLISGRCHPRGSSRVTPP